MLRIEELSLLNELEVEALLLIRYVESDDGESTPVAEVTLLSLEPVEEVELELVLLVSVDLLLKVEIELLLDEESVLAEDFVELLLCEVLDLDSNSK